MFGIFKEPRWYRKTKIIIIGLMLIIIPSLAFAGWFDGLTELAKEGTKAYVHTIYIQAVERQIITIGFWLYTILGTIQSGLAYLMMREVSESFQSAQHDGKISWKEMGLLSPYTLFSIILSSMLVIFAAFLFYTTYDGIQEIKSAGAINYENVEILEE